MNMGLCVSFNPLEHVWFLKALNPLLKSPRSEAWNAQGVAGLFPDLWHFLCSLNEDYWTAKRRCQRFPSRYRYRCRCSFSSHTLWPLVRGSSTGEKELQCGHRSLERVFTPTLPYKWPCLVSNHYFVLSGTRDIGQLVFWIFSVAEWQLLIFNHVSNMWDFFLLNSD